MEFGRSKDYLIWRWCDPNNCLHCGLALRTRRRCVEFTRSSATGAEGTQGSLIIARFTDSTGECAATGCLGPVGGIGGGRGVGVRGFQL